MDKLDLMLQMQLQNEDGGEIIQKGSVLMIENQNVYKTLQLVKNQVLLEIFEAMHRMYSQRNISSKLVKCLSQSLRLYSI